MAWSVSVLPDAEADLDALARGDAALRASLEDAILDEFDALKGDRVTKLFTQGVSTSSIDRLSGSEFPGSIRIQVRSDYRATVLCFPEYEQAYVTHVFHKSQDPKYRDAVPTHDKRAAQFVDSFTSFVNRRRRR